MHEKLLNWNGKTRKKKEEPVNHPLGIDRVEQSTLQVSRDVSILIHRRKINKFWKIHELGVRILKVAILNGTGPTR